MISMLYLFETHNNFIIKLIRNPVKNLNNIVVKCKDMMYYIVLYECALNKGNNCVHDYLKTKKM
jgi:hypothetical protein